MAAEPGSEEALDEIARDIGWALLACILSNQRLGHTDIRETVRTYVHVSADAEIHWLVREALLGHGDAIKKRFPALMGRAYQHLAGPPAGVDLAEATSLGDLLLLVAPS